MCLVRSKETSTSGILKKLKLYTQGKNDTEKESDNIEVSVSNAKYFLHHFFGLANKYDWAYPSFRVVIEDRNKNMFRQVEYIFLSGMKTQAFGSFGTQGIVNITQPISSSLQAHALVNIENKDQDQTSFYGRFRSDIISKAIEGSI